MCRALGSIWLCTVQVVPVERGEGWWVPIHPAGLPTTSSPPTTSNPPITANPPITSTPPPRHVKEADKPIIAAIKAAGRLVDNAVLVHSYPYCWRSDTPLIYRAVPSWFVAVGDRDDTRGDGGNGGRGRVCVWMVSGYTPAHSRYTPPHARHAPPHARHARPHAPHALPHAHVRWRPSKTGCWPTTASPTGCRPM